MSPLFLWTSQTRMHSLAHTNDTASRYQCKQLKQVDALKLYLYYYHQKQPWQPRNNNAAARTLYTLKQTHHPPPPPPLQETTAGRSVFPQMIQLQHSPEQDLTPPAFVPTTVISVYAPSPMRASIKYYVRCASNVVHRN